MSRRNQELHCLLPLSLCFSQGQGLLEAGVPVMMGPLWKDIMNRCRFSGEFALPLGVTGARYPFVTGDVVSVLHNPLSSPACTRLDLPGLSSPLTADSNLSALLLEQKIICSGSICWNHRLERSSVKWPWQKTHCCVLSPCPLLFLSTANTWVLCQPRAFLRNPCVKEKLGNLYLYSVSRKLFSVVKTVEDFFFF